MNERIYDIALEVLKDYPGLESWAFNNTELEQFASMIIDECITAAVEAQADFYVVNNIKNRFGI